MKLDSIVDIPSEDDTFKGTIHYLFLKFVLAVQILNFCLDLQAQPSLDPEENTNENKNEEEDDEDESYPLLHAKEKKEKDESQLATTGKSLRRQYR